MLLRAFTSQARSGLLWTRPTARCTSSLTTNNPNQVEEDQEFDDSQVPTLNEILTKESIQDLTGVPIDQLERTAIIYRPTRCTMQSGWRKTKLWRLEFPKEPKWQDRLMGWTASADPLHPMRLRFQTPEQAASYCREAGWNYKILEAYDEQIVIKSYGDRFKFKPLPKDDPIV